MNYLIKAINTIKNKEKTVLISLVGGGGKTTTLYQLAEQLDGQILITTTTAMFYPKDKVKTVYINETPTLEPGTVALFSAHNQENHKVKGISKHLVTTLYKAGYDYIINEADGARTKPLKCYGNHEPVIPKETDLLLVLIGADAFDQTLNEKNVHRSEIYSEISGLALNEEITPESVIKVLTHQQGFLKDIPEKSKAMILINKSLCLGSDFDKSEFAKRIFLQTDRYSAVLFTEMKDNNIFDVYENPIS